MSEHEKAEQARKGLFDSVKGKAKEIAGAVTGNDSLTAEGQLEQTQAQQRKEANSVEAVADAEAEQAHAEKATARIEGAQERIAVNAETAAVENSVREQQAAQKRAAEQAAQQDALRGLAPSSSRNTRYSAPRPRNAKRSAPLPRRPSMPRQNTRARCRRRPPQNRRPITSGGRPTGCPTKPTCPEGRPQI